MNSISKEKRSALEWIDGEAERLSQFAQEIWNYAEPAFREYKSARAYCALLRREGFEVEEGSAGMLTASAEDVGFTQVTWYAVKDVRFHQPVMTAMNVIR